MMHVNVVYMENEGNREKGFPGNVRCDCVKEDVISFSLMLRTN